MGLAQRELYSIADGSSVAWPAPAMPPWFALTVKPQHERSAERGLAAKQLEAYVPTYAAMSSWSDRLQRVAHPVFPGYVFCRLEPHQRTAVLQTPGVRSIVSFGGASCPIPDWEIKHLRQTLSSGLPAEPWPFLEVGRRVRITAGPLAGIDAVVLRLANGWRAVVGIELLQRSVSVEIDRDSLGQG